MDWNWIPTWEFPRRGTLRLVNIQGEEGSGGSVPEEKLLSFSKSVRSLDEWGLMIVSPRFWLLKFVEIQGFTPATPSVVLVKDCVAKSTCAALWSLQVSDLVIFLAGIAEVTITGVSLSWFQIGKEAVTWPCRDALKSILNSVAVSVFTAWSSVILELILPEFSPKHFF